MTIDYLAHLRSEIDEYVSLLRTADLDAVVPGCPEWSMRDLTWHLGAVHRWAANIVITGEPGERITGPVERDELIDWFSEGAASLVDVLTTTDVQKEVWTFGPPSSVAFWVRRQAHETCVHLWDAYQSQGLTYEMNPELASDGIAEIISVMIPRQERQADLKLTTSVSLNMTDLDAEPFTIGEPANPVGSVWGSAQQLLLTCWRRLPVDDLRIEGDPDRVRSLFAQGLTA